MRGGAQPQLRCESTPKPIRYLQDRSGTEKGQEQSCLLQLARRGLARARLPHRRARSSTARQADSYEKVVRRFTDITGKSRSSANFIEENEGTPNGLHCGGDDCESDEDETPSTMYS